MRKQRFKVVLIIVLLTVVFYGAYYLKMLTVSPDGGKTVIVVLKSLNVRSDFWQTVGAGAQVAAKQAGAVIELAGPLQDTDADAQIKALQEAVHRKPQAIVVAPFNDERMPEIIAQIRSAGIRLVVIDTPLEVEPKPVFVGNDHAEAGRLAGKKAAEQTGNKPKVAILTDFKYSAISEQRKQGALEVLAEYPDSNYGTFYCGDSADRAFDIAADLMRDNPDFNVFITLSQSATLGTAKAIKENPNGKSVRLIGFDSSIAEIQLLEEGVLNATIVQKPFNMGYLGVKTALDLLDDKKNAGTFIDSTLVTRDNMNTPEIQKLLFPFIENQ